MKTQAIKVIANVLINGIQASPKDKNNGVYVVTEAEARNLIARKRAIKFDGKAETGNENPPSQDINELKNIAIELGVKFNPNIGAKNLEPKIYTVLNTKAEEIGLTFAQDLPLKDAYEMYKAKKAEETGDEDKLGAEELKEIAQAAEIKISDNMAEEDLQEFIETELEQYAQTLGLEIAEDDNATTLWAKIQEKLKETV